VASDASVVADDDAIAFVTAADERADRYDGRGDEGA
jgi:hypothetical protein